MPTGWTPPVAAEFLWAENTQLRNMVTKYNALVNTLVGFMTDIGVDPSTLGELADDVSQLQEDYTALNTRTSNVDNTHDADKPISNAQLERFQTIEGKLLTATDASSQFPI